MKRRTQNDDSADDAKEFNAHLQEAEATDLSELERTGSVNFNTKLVIYQF